mmetsp:Transcript_3785/g.3168  ORF Transcript_3785/g.3168 Transcript_3785/m.3168 type:complete len:154 (-) Transcript_3785:44-505(-)
MKITFIAILAMTLALTSAFRMRQTEVQSDIGAAVDAANNDIITDGEQLLNDATPQSQEIPNNFADQTLNSATQLDEGVVTEDARIQQHHEERDWDHGYGLHHEEREWDGGYGIHHEEREWDNGPSQGVNTNIAIEYEVPQEVSEEAAPTAERR